MEYKAPDAYRTISEVAEELDLPQHVLRFWETRFGQIKPLKRGGGRRYYRPDDVDLLKGIRHLLYGEGYTIKGVQRILKEHGAANVLALGRGAPGALAMIAGGQARGFPPRTRDAMPLAPPPGDDATTAGPDERPAGLPEGAARDLLSGAPALSRPGAGEAADAVPDGGAGAGEEPLPGGILPDDRSARPARFVGRMLGHEPARTGLTREEVKRLQATLIELLECKRLLDMAR